MKKRKATTQMVVSRDPWFPQNPTAMKPEVLRQVMARFVDRMFQDFTLVFGPTEKRGELSGALVPPGYLAEWLPFDDSQAHPRLKALLSDRYGFPIDPATWTVLWRAVTGIFRDLCTGARVTTYSLRDSGCGSAADAPRSRTN